MKFPVLKFTGSLLFLHDVSPAPSFSFSVFSLFADSGFFILAASASSVPFIPAMSRFPPSGLIDAARSFMSFIMLLPHVICLFMAAMLFVSTDCTFENIVSIFFLVALFLSIIFWWYVSTSFI